MLSIVVAQNVMCLYVQMCMSILRFHDICNGGGWMAFCLFAVSLLRYFSVHYTRHAIYRSFLGMVLITCWGFQTWTYTFYNCYFTNVDWHANLLQGLTMYMHEIHISGLFHTNKHAFKRPLLTSVEEYGWTLSKVICLNTSMLPHASCGPPSASIGAAEQPFLSDCPGAHSTEHFCPVTSNPPQRSDGISLVAST